MKNKLMHFVIIIVTVTIDTIIANNVADFVKLLQLKDQISQEMTRLNLTENEKEPIVKFFEEKQKESLQKFLDDQIKPNFKNISGVDRRAATLFLCDFGKNAISHHEQCILDENNTLDFCAACSAMFLLLNADHAVKEITDYAINEIGRDFFKQIETNNFDLNI